MLRHLLQGFRRPLTEPTPTVNTELEALGTNLDQVARKRLGRSLSIRQIDAGSCNGCEMEIRALNHAFHDLERFGLRFLAAPRHADVLPVTGPVTKNIARGAPRPIRNGWSRSAIAAPTPGSSPAATRSWAACPPSSPSIWSSAAARQRPCNCCKVCYT